VADEYDLAPKEESKKQGDSAGEPLPAVPGAPEGFVPPKVIIEPPDEEPADPDALDAGENYVSAVLAYLCFVIPLVYTPKSRFARFHANQALILQLHVLGLMLAYTLRKIFSLVAEHFDVLNSVDWWIGCFFIPVFYGLMIAFIVIAAQQALAAMDQERKKIAVIGHFALLKPLPEEK